MIIKIKVYPSSGREEIVKVSEDSYKAYLKKHAENGKANIELLKMLKKHFNKTPIILKGLKSRDKIINIKD
jgi:uncharacterized protein (TIGR00251 family)